MLCVLVLFLSLFVCVCQPRRKPSCGLTRNHHVELIENNRAEVTKNYHVEFTALRFQNHDLDTLILVCHCGEPSCCVKYRVQKQKHSQHSVNYNIYTHQTSLIELDTWLFFWVHKTIKRYTKCTFFSFREEYGFVVRCNMCSIICEV